MLFRKKPSLFQRCGLSITLIALFLVFLGLQFYTGWLDYNDELAEKGAKTLSVGEYFQSAHFLEATAENWESEFLQMGLYVLLTIWLKQRGSAESKPIHGTTSVDRKPIIRPGSPWAVKKGGWYLKIYQNSLSLAFVLLFLISAILHFKGSLNLYNQEQAMDGQSVVTAADYFGNSHFWFESFQNWQSEFLAVLSIVYLSVYLRQKGSPESKPVDAAHHEHG